MRYKYQIKFNNKALDFLITLKRVPFDASKKDVIQKALSTLGDLEYLNKNVQLVERTNKNLYFNITSDEKKLEEFFKRFYPNIPWEDVKKKFMKDDTKRVEEKDVDSKKDSKRLKEKENLEQALKKYFIHKGLQSIDLEFDANEELIKIKKVSDYSTLVKILSDTKRVNAVLEKIGLESSSKSQPNLQKGKLPYTYPARKIRK